MGIFIMLKSQKLPDRPECIAFTLTSIRSIFLCEDISVPDF